MLEIYSIGDLVEPGTYDYLNGFRRVANFTDGRRVISLAFPGVDPGPLNIVMRGFDPEVVKHVRVEPHAVFVDDVRVGFSDDDIYISSILLLRRDIAEFRRNLALFGSYLLELAPAESLVFLLDRARASTQRPGFQKNLAEHVRHCARDILYWNRERGVSRLRGAGVGFTPSGDDFIAGFLMGLVVLERMGLGDWSDERDRVMEWTGLSCWDVLEVAFLSCAAGGFAFESMRELIIALDLGPAEYVRSWTESLLAIGATSGADIGVGFYLTVHEGMAGRLKGSQRTPVITPTINESRELWS
ncbi:MAG: DUF2877 domain-containing protein [Candidatus Eisenbacteria bacterium]